jgi:hypothetical protein
MTAGVALYFTASGWVYAKTPHKKVGFRVLSRPSLAQLYRWALQVITHLSCSYNSLNYVYFYIFIKFESIYLIQRL